MHPFFGGISRGGRGRHSRKYMRLYSSSGSSNDNNDNNESNSNNKSDNNNNENNNEENKQEQEQQESSNSGSSNSNDSSSSIFQALQERMSAFDLTVNEKMLKIDMKEKWRNANCEVFYDRIVLPDWVRRMDMDDVQYPLGCCGSAGGTVYVFDAVAGTVCASSSAIGKSNMLRIYAQECEDNGFLYEEMKELENERVAAAQAAAAQEEEQQIQEENQFKERMEHVLELLHGPYDGDGTFAITMCNKLICAISDRKTGAIDIYRYYSHDQEDEDEDNNDEEDIDTEDLLSEATSTSIFADITSDEESSNTPPQQKQQEKGHLLYQGTMERALGGTIVSCVHLDHDFLWVGTEDGRILAFSTSSSLPLQHTPFYAWDFAEHHSYPPADNVVTSLSFNDEIGIGICSLASGKIVLFPMDEDSSDRDSEEGDHDDEHEHDIITLQMPMDENGRTRVPTSTVIGRYGGDTPTEEYNIEEEIYYLRFALYVGCDDGTLFVQEIVDFAAKTHQYKQKKRGDGGSAGIAPGDAGFGFDDGSSIIQEIRNTIQKEKQQKKTREASPWKQATTKEDTTADENENDIDDDDDDNNNMIQCYPSHEYGSAIKCICCPSSNILVTGSTDGTIRVWDYNMELFEDDDEVDNDEKDEMKSSIDYIVPNILYCFEGYKVWMGSMWTDGIRLLSDGADNRIVIHDYEKYTPD